MDVGERLKTIRKMKGLSQRELAKRVGVTNSTISMIEKNGVSPSVSSLKKVLSGIPITLGDFFTLDLETLQGDNVVFSAAEMPNVGCNSVNLFLVGAPVANRTMDIYKERYAPGADTGPEMLSHEGEEGGVVVVGEIELTVDFKVYTLKAGDGFYFNSSRPHRFRNVSGEVCEIVSANPPS